MADQKRRPRGQVIPLGDKSFGIRVQTTERGPNGRPRTHYETLNHTTEVKAHKYKDELLARIDAGLFFCPAPLLVSALIKEWLDQKQRGGLRPASLYTYTDAANAYLKPHIGQLQLKAVTPLAVRNLYNALQDRGLSDTTIKYARTVLNLIMRDAVRWGYLKENPARDIPAPKGAAGRVAHCMNVDEARFHRSCAARPRRSDLRLRRADRAAARRVFRLAPAASRTHHSWRRRAWSGPGAAGGV
ncbi:MAG: phage integrase central domain-containing protein [Pyrinomonadaceae bacterium]